MKLKIGFTYDAKTDYKLKPGDSSDKYAEFDSDATIAEISGALASPGHEIVRIGHAGNLLKRIKSGEKWDIVFNIAEGVSGRNRESQVPMILEMHGIPYTGSDALTMGLALDKTLAKTVIAYNGLPTPAFFLADNPGDVEKCACKFPAIVKPNEEGTSKGISGESVAHDKAAAAKRAEFIINTYKQPALIEEFIFGQEFTVGVIGNDNPEALPPLQVIIKGETELGDQIYTQARVVNDELDYLCPSSAPEELQDKLKQYAARAFKLLGCRDLARIDFRVDRDGTPYFLECNPLPHLGLIDAFPLYAKATGRTYEQIIVEILNHALKRYNIK
ncbi:MAG: ATP-grasp domain-containing protein [Elusimicrobiota bacterium]